MTSRISGGRALRRGSPSLKTAIRLADTKRLQGWLAVTQRALSRGGSSPAGTAILRQNVVLLNNALDRRLRRGRK